MSKHTSIKLPQEQYELLLSVATQMKSQNNQGTSFPLYCIYDREPDDTIKFVTCFFTEEGMNKHLEDYGESLNDPFTRIRSMAYNEEISELMKILVSLDELVLPKHDNKAYGK